jgi:hypothetical protein
MIVLEEDVGSSKGHSATHKDLYHGVSHRPNFTPDSDPPPPPYELEAPPYETVTAPASLPQESDVLNSPEVSSNRRRGIKGRFIRFLSFNTLKHPTNNWFARRSLRRRAIKRRRFFRFLVLIVIFLIVLFLLCFYLVSRTEALDLGLIFSSSVEVINTKVMATGGVGGGIQLPLHGACLFLVQYSHHRN